jgi:hypothetical protein
MIFWIQIEFILIEPIQQFPTRTDIYSGSYEIIMMAMRMMRVADTVVGTLTQPASAPAVAVSDHDLAASTRIFDNPPAASGKTSCDNLTNLASLVRIITLLVTKITLFSLSLDYTAVEQVAILKNKIITQ